MITLNMKHRHGGKLIFGFPGVGKSVAASINHSCIDLESSHFKNDTQFPCRYCEVAYELSMQGNCVFMSTHQAVRDFICNNYLNQLLAYNVKVCILCPDISLKNDWIKRLYNRYIKQPSSKNQRAYENVKNNFDQYVQELNDYAHTHQLELINIKELDYNLLDLI